MQRGGVFLAILLCCSLCRGQNVFRQDWLQGLLDNIEKTNAGINRSVQQLNQRIQQDVQTRLAEVDQITRDAQKTIAENARSGGQDGSTIIINGNGGTSRSVFSGRTPDGQPYFRDTERTVIGDTLHVHERYYDPETRKMKERRYNLNLKDPNAKPVPIDDEKK